jgi:transposase
LKAFENYRQFAYYSLTAPFEYSSGSSVKCVTKVNHMSYKKTLLQMGALVAIKHNSQLKEYQHKKMKEKKY